MDNSTTLDTILAQRSTKEWQEKWFSSRIYCGAESPVARFSSWTALDLTLGVLATLWLIFFAYYLEESYEYLNNCSFLG